MEKIKIAHLYYDLMNLYGEIGNIMALEEAFNNQDMYTEITNLTVGDNIDFNKYDIYYMGCGSEESQEIVIEEVLECNLYKEVVIAFQNRQCVLNNKENHLFNVIEGYADNYKSSHEGIHYKNLYATYNLGPLLIRNPILTNYIVKEILDKKDILYKSISTTSFKAYNEYVKNFIS